jgi:cytochrome b561
MNPLSAVVRLFVNTFGITQPTPEKEARAGRVILLMLLAVLVLLGAAGWLLRTAFAR